MRTVEYESINIVLEKRLAVKARVNNSAKLDKFLRRLKTFQLCSLKRTTSNIFFTITS